jgi:hypothetical protein
MKPATLERALRRGAVVLIVCLAAGLGALGASGSAPSPAAQSTPFPIPIGGGVVLPPQVPLPDMVIESLTLDRAYYFVDMDWSATVRVRNVGEIPSGSYHVVAQLCRLLEGTLVVNCSDVETVLVTGGNLDVNEVVEIGSGSISFDSLPTDDSPTYTSAIPGVPNGGTVYVQATVHLGSPGQASPPEEDITVNNSALTTVTYPSAPANPSYDPAQDGDGDGWYASEDCNDTNPDVSPWSYEFAGNGLDDDCYGGDASPDTTCTQDVFYAQEQGGCNPPGFWNPFSAGLADVDGDGAPAGEDCDDLNSAVSPNAEEQDDGIDNNCNGLVDEGFVTPDWVFDSFELFHGWVHPGYLVGDYSGITLYHMPALRYHFEIANVGEGLGGGDAGLVDNLVLIRDLEGQIFATGETGFIPYTAFDYGPGYVPACSPVSLIALIPGGGIYGETNTANNAMVGNTPPQPAIPNVIVEGTFDRDLRFASAPEIGPSGASHNSEAVGSCPPLLDYALSSDLPNVYLIGYRVYIEGVLVTDLTEADSYSLGHDFQGDLQGGDRICYEVRLDPDNYVFEVDEGNNTYLQVFEYHNPIIGSPRFDLIDAYSDGPGTCASGELVAGGVGSTGSALTSSGVAPLLGGIGGAVLLGALAAAIALYGARWLGGSQPSMSIVGLAAAAGVLAGGWGGAALTARLGRPAPPQISVQTPGEEANLGPTSCDLLVDWTRAGPADGETKRPGDALWIQVETQELSEVLPTDRLILDLVNPAGNELVIPMPAPGPSGGSSDLDLIASVVHLAGADFFLPGEYTWQVALGESATGDDTTPYVSTCWGSTVRHFSILGEVGPKPSATSTLGAEASPTASPSPSPLPPTRTATVTATPVVDITGPSISKVGDSPDPIYVSQPAGCSPNTTVITATLTDPSGVESASVLFFHTTIGQVPMTHGSGDTWSATLGPFTGVGDGTADYQIRATDEVGNVSESAFAQVTVLACLP